jgi:hypothetical protein
MSRRKSRALILDDPSILAHICLRTPRALSAALSDVVFLTSIYCQLGSHPSLSPRTFAFRYICDNRLTAGEENSLVKAIRRMQSNVEPAIIYEEDFNQGASVIGDVPLHRSAGLQ